MKRLGPPLLLALGLACQVSLAQTNPPAAAPPARLPDRYLLLFDTSAAMKRRAKAVEQAARELITSGMYGQLRRGDTIGVWTFDAQLHAGLFPLQVWQSDAKEEIASQVVNFLKSRKYQNKPRLDAVLPSLQQLIGDSPKLTAILFSDGATPLQGTPFDANVNAVYAEYQRPMQKSRTPFLTVLRAKHGQIFAAAVGMPPWPVDFPPYPPEPSEASLVPGSPAGSSPAKQPAPTPPAKTVAPIILDMSKPKRAETNPPTETITSFAPPRTDTQTPAVITEPPAAEPTPASPPGIVKPILPETATATTVPERAASPVESAGEVQTQSPAAAKPDLATVQPSATPGPPPAPPASKPAVKPAAPEKPVRAATSIPHQTVPSGRWTLLAASLLLTAAAILLVVLLLRQRAQRGTSLITRSMEQDKE